MIEVAGLFAPLVTPLTDDGSTVSEVRMARLVRSLNERGVSGFVVGSDTGEFFTLSLSERKDALEYALREAQGKPILVNATAISTSATLDLAQHAQRHGARAALVAPPFYGPATDDEIIKHFETVAGFANLPIAFVNAGRIVDAATADRIANIPNVVVAEHAPVASSDLSTDAFKLSSAVSLPAAVLIQSGDFEPVSELVRRFGGAKVVKAGLEIVGVEVGPTRPPLRSLAREDIDSLAAAMGGPSS